MFYIVPQFLKAKPARLVKRYTVARSYDMKDAVQLDYKVHKPNLKTINVPPIIVTHGFLGNKKNWQSVSRSLSSKLGRDVIAVDMRNHGDSPHVGSHTYKDMASDMERLMNDLNIERGILVGHSMGGRAAMVLSLLRPQRVASLIVVDISPVQRSKSMESTFFVDIMETMRGIRFSKHLTVTEARRQAKDALRNVADDESTLDFLVLNLALDETNEMKWKVNVDVLIKFYRSHISQFPPDLGGLQFMGPSLFVAGHRSDFVDMNDLPVINGYFPAAELKYLDAGHNVHIEAMPGFVTLVSQFIQDNIP